MGFWIPSSKDDEASADAKALADKSAGKPFFHIYVLGPAVKCRKFNNIVGNDLPPTLTKAKRNPKESSMTAENMNTKNGARKYKKKAIATGMPK